MIDESFDVIAQNSYLSRTRTPRRHLTNRRHLARRPEQPAVAAC